MDVKVALSNAVGVVRKRIQQTATARLGEQNTKAALIDPILIALGWVNTLIPLRPQDGNSDWPQPVSDSRSYTPLIEGMLTEGL
jgi:hypothetical protein